MSESLWCHGLQHSRLLSIPLSPTICSDSCPLSQWCYITISSSASPTSFCLQSFPTSGSLPMSWLSVSGGQSIGDSASVQFSSVAQSCLTLCNSMHCSMPGLPVHHQWPEFTQTHVHWVGDAIQLSHPLSSPVLPPSIFPSIRVFSNKSVLPSGGQSIGVSALTSSIQWIFRTDFL